MSGAARALQWRDQRVYFLGRKVRGNPLNPLRDGDRDLKLCTLNEEFRVSASHELALITSLPFVHTARRYYRSNGLVRASDRPPGERLPVPRRDYKTTKLDHLEEVKVVTRFP